MAALLAVAVTAALGIWATAALAGEDVTADLTGDKYDKASYAGDEGETATLVNPVGADSPHNITAKLRGPDGKPLFQTKTIAPGNTSAISGLQYLAAGTYKFVCTIHAGMTADYMISNKGTPVARPKIDLTIPFQTLKKVRNSGKLKVKVKAVTKSAGITVEARKGATLIGRATGLTLSAGASRTINVALSARGRKALKGLSSAAVSANGSVPFGKPDSARRTLR